jgi:hypothetical protein
LFTDESLLHTSIGINVPLAAGRLTATLLAAALQVTSPEVSVQLADVHVCPECASVIVPMEVTGDPLT